MRKKLAVLVCAFACLIGANGVRAQSTLFYDNSVDDNFYFPAGVEIAMPIAFSGSYEVDSFAFGFFLPPNDPAGPTTDAIIRFYTAGPSGGAFGDGTLIAASRLTNLVSDVNTVVVTDDLTTFGDFFQWDATLLASGETGGWMSIEFTNPDAGWELSTGDSQDDFYQDMTDGTYFDFGGVPQGNPQTAFYVQLYGQQIITAVPDPGATALLAGLIAPGGFVYLRHRRRSHPSGR